MGRLVHNITPLLSALTGTSSGVYVFLDEYGNVTQIKKVDKSRLKYYIDPEIPETAHPYFCVIGVSDEESGPCSYGEFALGIGDTMMTYAIYE